MRTKGEQPALEDALLEPGGEPVDAAEIAEDRYVHFVAANDRVGMFRQLAAHNHDVAVHHRLRPKGQIAQNGYNFTSYRPVDFRSTDHADGLTANFAVDGKMPEHGHGGAADFRIAADPRIAKDRDGIGVHLTFHGRRSEDRDGIAHVTFFRSDVV